MAFNLFVQSILRKLKTVFQVPYQWTRGGHHLLGQGELLMLYQVPKFRSTFSFIFYAKDNSFDVPVQVTLIRNHAGTVCNLLYFLRIRIHGFVILNMAPGGQLMSDPDPSWIFCGH